MPATVCPTCRRVVAAPDGAAGQPVTCPECGDRFRLGGRPLPVARRVRRRVPAWAYLTAAAANLRRTGSVPAWAAIAAAVAVGLGLGMLALIFVAVRVDPSPRPAPVPPPTIAPAAPVEKEPVWPYKFVNTKTERNKLGSDVMDLYAYSGPIDMTNLTAFCRERRKRSTAGVLYYAVIFDSAEAAGFPVGYPLRALYDTEHQCRHVRAVYCYNKINGFSELSYYPTNMWTSRPEDIKP